MSFKSPLVKKWDRVVWYECADVRTGGKRAEVMEIKPDGSLRLEINHGSGHFEERVYSCKHVDDPWLLSNERGRKRDGGWDTVANDQVRDDEMRDAKNVLARKLESDAKITVAQEELKIEDLEKEVLALKGELPVPRISAKLRQQYSAYPALVVRIHDDWVNGVLTKAEPKRKERATA